MAWHCPLCDEINDDNNLLKCPCGYEREVITDRKESKECPNCRLIRPYTAIRCECGYDFPTGKIKASYLTKSEQKIFTNWQSFICPKCGKKFPLFTRPSSVIRRGFFSTPWIRCSNCGTISRATISWSNAFWAWPLSFLIYKSIPWFQKTRYFKNFYKNYSSIYYLFCIFLMIAIFYFMRCGFKLVSVSEVSYHKNSIGKKMFISILLSVSVISVVYLYWQSWTYFLIILITSIVVNLIFYFFENKQIKTN